MHAVNCDFFFVLSFLCSRFVYLCTMETKERRLTSIWLNPKRCYFLFFTSEELFVGLSNFGMALGLDRFMRLFCLLDPDVNVVDECTAQVFHTVFLSIYNDNCTVSVPCLLWKTEPHLKWLRRVHDLFFLGTSIFWWTNMSSTITVTLVSWFVFSPECSTHRVKLRSLFILPDFS